MTNLKQIKNLIFINFYTRLTNVASVNKFSFFLAKNFSYLKNRVNSSNEYD